MRRVLFGAVLAAALAGCSGGGSGSRSSDVEVARGNTNFTISPKLYPRFGDRDPHDWDGRAPSSYAVHGLDVSRWQGDIDWKTARRSGISFVMIKATEGVEELDPKFSTHWEGARKAGVVTSGYHFFYWCAPADKQARWFIQNVPKGSPIPHVLDLEWNPHSPTCRYRPDGDKVRAEAKRFLDILERHYGRRPVVYTPIDFYRDTDIGRLPRTEFWLRSVAGHPSEKFPGQRWSFWQYTGTGVVPGVPGPVDINVFSGSADTWKRYLR